MKHPTLVAERILILGFDLIPYPKFYPIFPLDTSVWVRYCVISKDMDENISNPTPVAPKKKIALENLPDLLTVKEVAELLRVSPLTIKRWGKRGKLSPIRINSRGDRRYKKEAVLWLLGIQPAS